MKMRVHLEAFFQTLNYAIAIQGKKLITIQKIIKIVLEVNHARVSHGQILWSNFGPLVVHREILIKLIFLISCLNEKK